MHAAPQERKTDESRTVLPVPCLLLWTERMLLPGGMPLGQAIASAVTGGANLVVFRETALPAGARRTVARFVKNAVRGRAPLLMTGDPAFAAKAGAGGVHVEAPGAIEDARSAFGVGVLVGVTVRSAEEARAASEAGADYLLAGFDWSAPDTAIEAVRRLAEASSTPLVAGIDPPLDHVAAILRAGAAGIALCEPAMAAADRTAAVRAYAQALSSD